MFVIIQLLVCDVDGTLTDGTITYMNSSVESKTFSVKDGLILKFMAKIGFSIVLLTGRESEAVARRADDIGAIAIQGIDDKAVALKSFIIERGIISEQCAYIGDDLNDYSAIKGCGFRACPADAAREIRHVCNYISPFPGGHGAVRDICERLLIQEGKYEKLLEYYGV